MTDSVNLDCGLVWMDSRLRGNDGAGPARR